MNVITSGAYISKWGGVGLLPAWGTLILWHYVGLVFAILVGIGIKRYKLKKRTATVTATATSTPTTTPTTKAKFRTVKKIGIPVDVGFLMGNKFAWQLYEMDSIWRPSMHATTKMKTTNDHVESAPFLFEVSVDEMHEKKNEKAQEEKYVSPKPYLASERAVRTPAGPPWDPSNIRRGSQRANCERSECCSSLEEQKR